MTNIDKDLNEEETLEFTGEDNVDDIEIEEAETGAKDKVKKVKTQLSVCQEEKAQALEDLQRAKADFLNTKKRLEEQGKLDRERTLNTFLASLLPLCDSFDMAFSDTTAWQAVDENWRKGVEGIKSQLDSILKQHSVTTFGARDEHFDPSRHEAMSAVDDGGESETVAEILQQGYERNGEVIRPAKVIIRS